MVSTTSYDPMGIPQMAGETPPAVEERAPREPQFNFDAAEQRNVPQREIVEFLAPKLNFNLEGARRAGATDEQIYSFFKQRSAMPSTPTPTPPPSAAEGAKMVARETGQNIYGVARGGLAAALGGPGDIESLARTAARYSPYGFFGLNPFRDASQQRTETILPTTEEVSRALPLPEAGGDRGKSFEQIGQILGLPLSPKVVQGVMGVPSRVNRALGLSGEGQRALNELKDLITSGRFESEALSGLRADLAQQGEATRNMIDSLRQFRQITDDQASRALAALQRSEGSTLRTQRETARRAGQESQAITRELEGAGTEAQVGQSLADDIKREMGGVAGQRRSVGKSMYDDAEASMAQKFREGNFWQNSESGQAFLARLRAMESATVEGGVALTESQRATVRNIIKDLEGVAIERPGGRVLGPTGQPVVAPKTEMAYAQPNRIVTKLRELRDSASGRPAAGYSAIDQQFHGRLADQLAAALKPWDETLAQADAMYKRFSEMLRPTQTRAGQAATRGEAFNVEQLQADPAGFAAMFFNSPKSVAELRSLLGNNTTLLNQRATEYVMSQFRQFRNNPAGARNWMEQNRDWLNPETLRVAHINANRVVQGLESATRASEAATAAAARTRARYQEGAKPIMEHRADMRERLAAQERALEKGFAQRQQDLKAVEGDVAKLVSNVRAGSVEPERVPNALRSLLNSEKGQRIPEDARNRLAAQINDLEAIQSAEVSRQRRAAKTLRWLVGGTIGVGASGYLANKIFGMSGPGGR